MARRTKEDALATREALLDAAEHVFLERGVTRASLHEIARTAGLTRGAVYWHFEGKADLFNAMMERVTLPLEADLNDLCDGTIDPVQRLFKRMRQAFHTIVHDEQTRRVVTIATLAVEQVGELSPVRARHSQRMHDNISRIERALVESARRRGRPPLPEPRALAQGLHAIIHGLIQSWLVEDDFDLEATAEIALRNYLDGAGLPINGQTTPGN